MTAPAGTSRPNARKIAAAIGPKTAFTASVTQSWWCSFSIDRYREFPEREDAIVRTAAAPAATTIEVAPTITPTGGRRKRASITYATKPSITYLVKNFTRGKIGVFFL